MKPDVALVIPYFGKLPSYFDPFIQSVSEKNLDVLFFTDCKKPDGLPPNVLWNNINLSSLKELISIKLSQPVSLEVSYKLCDFKPALGLIFEDFIKDYKFWGYSDIDICIGNFEKYINNNILEQIDVYSCIKEYFSACFFLMRNNEYCKNLFKRSKDWKSTFKNPHYLRFDECGGPYFHELKKGKKLRDLNPPIESFTEVLFSQSPSELRTYFDNVIIEPGGGLTYVSKNKICYQEKEYLLVHYVCYKVWSFYTNKKVHFPFYITKLGFFQKPPFLFNLVFSKNYWVALFFKVKNKLVKIEDAIRN